MGNKKSIFWNEREGRLRGLWRLLLQALMLIIIAFFIAIILGIITSVIREGFLPVIPEVYEKSLMMLYSVLAMALATLLSVYWAGKMLDKRKFSDFGLTLKKEGLFDLLSGFILGGVLISLIFFIEYYLGWAKIKETFVSFTPESPFYLDILIPLVIYIFVGIEEELVSRGYQLLNLSESLGGMKFLGKTGGLIIATLLSSIIFGGLHISNPDVKLPGIINIVLAGVLLGLGFIYTGKLSFSIGLHISWNFFQGNVFGFPVSGVKELPVSFITIEQNGNELWTGGLFGPEGGLLGTLIIILGILVLLIWTRFRYQRIENRMNTREFSNKT